MTAVTTEKSWTGELEVVLHYRDGMPPVGEPRSRPGEYLGSGDGTIIGPGLRGSVRWDLNEHVGPNACQMSFAGVVETEDAARIALDALGFGQIVDRDTAPSRWLVVAAVRFVTDDPRYAWLTSRPATWLGEFDSSTYEHWYRLSAARV